MGFLMGVDMMEGFFMRIECLRAVFVGVGFFGRVFLSDCEVWGFVIFGVLCFGGNVFLDGNVFCDMKAVRAI